MIITIKANIEKSSVLRFLGYKDINKIPDAILTKVDSVLNKIPEISGNIIYDEFKFGLDVKNKKILLNERNSFCGDKIFKTLSDCNSLVIAISTLENDFKKIYEEIASGGAIYEMIIDAIGTAALNDINNRFWVKLVDEYKSRGYGLTERFAPGDNNWSLADQKTIFSVLNGNKIGVKLNEKYIMEPEKSLTMVYGIKEGKSSSLNEHNCEKCSLTGCSFRKEPQKHTLKISLNGREKSIQVKHGEKLFDVLAKNNISIPNSCGGNHTCGKCLVQVDSPILNSISDKENELLKRINASDSLRLACFINVNQDMHITLPDEDEIAQIIITGKKDIEHDLKPRVKKKIVKSLLDYNQQDYLNVFLNSLEFDPTHVAYNAIKKLPELNYKNASDLSYITYEDEIIDVSDDIKKGVYGIAVDIGTTTIVAYLINLEDGKEIDVYSCLNPQKKYGADVISRINYTSQNEDGLNELHRLVISELNNIIDKFCKYNDIHPENIYDIVLVGNTTMLHLAACIPCKQIAIFPFRPAFTSSIKVKAKDLGLKSNPESYIITLPSVSSYIGADTMAAILACGMHKDKKTSLLIDIGTNGEIVLGNADKMICCSTAAGPAFEGGRITFGTGGIRGAIDHIDLKKQPIYSTIGNTYPVGICGSGVTDAVAELLRYNIVDKTGRMKNQCELKGKITEDLLKKVVTYEGINAFVIDEKTRIVITQADIRELQLAKAAIFAGIQVLADKASINLEEIENVYLAGGFGNFLDLNSAFTIKLLPQEFEGKVIPIGNGAGIGAKIVLSFEDALSLLNTILVKMEYIELSISPEFQEKFIKAINF